MSSFGRVLTLQQILDSFPEDKPVGATAIRDLIATLCQGGVNPQFTSSNAMTAHAGGGQANGTLCASYINRFTTVATAGDSALLPKSQPGLEIHVVNAGAASMNVFPQSGDSINGGSANAAVALAAGKSAIYGCAIAGQWHAVLSA
jgi:hypothetical protein